jgi:putative ABC transport system permease protein
LQSIQTVSIYSLVGAVVAGSIIILLTMIMTVRERKREIGILKAIGCSNVRVVLQFVAEALTLTLLGAVVGLGIGMTAGSPITKALVENSANSPQQTDKSSGPGVSIVSNLQGIRDVQAEVGLGTILDGLGAAVVIALMGSIIASLAITKIRPAEVLRSE